MFIICILYLFILFLNNNYRFFGGVILNWLSPKRFLIISTLISIAGFAEQFLAPSDFNVIVSILLIGLGFANIFRLVFNDNHVLSTPDAGGTTLFSISATMKAVVKFTSTHQKK